MSNSIFSQFRKQIADLDCAEDLPGDFFIAVVELSKKHEDKARKAAKRASASAAVTATAPAVLASLTKLCTAMNTPVRLADVGSAMENPLSNRVPQERQLLAKCFSHLQKTGQAHQVGWRDGQILAVGEVNNFQRRWVFTGFEIQAPAEVSSETDESEDAGESGE
jgi:predicted nucleic acid-binding protein